jgi:hypothetical protein
VTDHLTDIASDLSVFHRIDDASGMEAAVFFALVFRLPAYQGALAATAAQQARNGGGGQQARRSYERDSPMANNARVARNAPAATPAALAQMNAQLGGGWISHRTVKPDPAPGGDGK